ncbi:hypothetical protein R1flu_023400 [Riccia fluitans]|uniref:PpiC domain-containing protein n=1 Tax=Riccia fluitans TaxID=41844 RepID=A0ABD1XRY8_9MARC
MAGFWVHKLRPQNSVACVIPFACRVLAGSGRNASRSLTPFAQSAHPPWIELSSESVSRYSTYSRGAVTLGSRCVSKLYQFLNSLPLPPTQSARISVISRASSGRVEAEGSVAKCRKEGLDLSYLAAEYSICPSKDEGGRLGWLAMDQIDPAFEEAASGDPVNKLVRAKTKYGWHLLQQMPSILGPLLGERGRAFGLNSALLDRKCNESQAKFCSVYSAFTFPAQLRFASTLQALRKDDSPEATVQPAPSNENGANSVSVSSALGATAVSQEECPRPIARKQPPKKFGAAAVVWNILNVLASGPWEESTAEALAKLKIQLKNHHVSQVVRGLQDAESALEFFNWCKTQDGYKHDALNYNMLIGKLATAHKLDHITPLLQEMHDEGWSLHSNTLTTLIVNHCRCNKIPEILKIFDEAPERYGLQPNLGAYTCLIDMLAKRNDFERATKYYSEMQESGSKLDNTAYNVLMRAFGRAKDVDKVCELFESMEAEGHTPDKYTFGFLISALARSGRIDEALVKFKAMKEAGHMPDVPTYNQLIDSLGKVGKADEACEIFEELLQMGHQPDVVTYNTIFDCMGRAGRVNDVYKRYKEMQLRGVVPDAITCSILVDTLGKAGRLEKACDLFLEMTRTPEFKFDVAVYNSMLNRLGKAGRIDQLLKLYNEMKESDQAPDVVSCNIVMDALCKVQEYQKAHQIFTEMENLGLKPDVVTYNNLIHSFGKAGKVARASKIFREMLKAGLVPDLFSYNIMINVLGKARKSDKALKILQDMKRRGMIPDVMTYNRLIDTFSKAGDTKAAAHLFREMQENGIRPDLITYTVLINGLANAGKMDSAKKVYRDMRDKGYQPDVVTFNCMITGYVREGRVNEANELLIRMKGSRVRPTATTYGILIDANARYAKDDMVQKLRKERNEAGFLPEEYR